MLFFSPLLTSLLSHWPMQGPHALANTSPPTASSVSSCVCGCSCSHVCVCDNMYQLVSGNGSSDLLRAWSHCKGTPIQHIDTQIKPQYTVQHTLFNGTVCGVNLWWCVTDLVLMPCWRACLAILAARVMSSYELLVQLPISATNKQTNNNNNNNNTT